jgi:hypothetical protein
LFISLSLNSHSQDDDVHQVARLKRSTRARTRSIVAVVVLAIACLLAALPAHNASAAALTDARVTLGGAPGWYDYTFHADGGSTGTAIGCISIRFNTAADGSGSTPPGINAAGASMDWNNFITNTTGWSYIERSTGFLRYAKNTGTTARTSGGGDMVIGNMTYPTSGGVTYFAILSTYTSNDCLTGAVDSTTIAFVKPIDTVISVVVDPTLSFTISNRATACNNQTPTSYVDNSTGGANTGPSSLPLGNLISGTSRGSAQNLNVATNAGNGFSVYVKGAQSTQNLRSGSHNFTDVSGAYGVNGNGAASFDSGEAFGYTAADATSGSTINFGSNQFVALTNTSQSVMRGGVGVMAGSSCIGFQAGASNSTPAGVYTATVIYTVVPTF